MTTKTVNLKEDAEVLRICLETTITSVPEAVEWADKYIEQTAEPDFSMIEVSLAGRKSADDVARILADVKGKADEKRVIKRVFDIMKSLFERDPKQDTAIAHALFKIASAGKSPSKEAESFMFWFDDELSLTRSGYKRREIEELHKELRDFLNKEMAI